MNLSKNNQGFALLEVMIALFIISFGLLNLLGMQITALQQAQDAYFRSMAIVQLKSMLERLRANQTGASRNSELIRWNQSNARVLPKGQGSYQCGSMSCTATVFWFVRQKQELSL